MTALKNFQQYFKHTLNNFFDLDFGADEQPVEKHQTPNAMDPQQLQHQMLRLVDRPQTVSLQIKLDQPATHQTTFLVGQFRNVDWQKGTAVFQVSHSNLIQLIHFNQIIRIAA